MKAYKGFDKDLKCRGFQYKVGETYTEDEAVMCEKGFHACEDPLDVFNYYPPANSRYCEVELEEVSPETADDSKRVANEITIVKELTLNELIAAAIEGAGSKDVQSGDYSAATNTGYYSAATNTGYRSAATNTGDSSAATNTGNYSAATNTGYRSAASVEGGESIAIVTGLKSKAKGVLGCWLVLTERDDGWNILGVQTVKVDGEKIKADTYYTLEDGEIVEV